MQAYTNVVLDRAERDALSQAALHLRIAFPRMDEEMPKRRDDRLDDHAARVIGQLVRDSQTGTFDNLTRADGVLGKLARVVEDQSTMDYWIAEHHQNPHAPDLDLPSGGAMTARQQYQMLADIRAGQLRDVQRAIAIVRQALTMATPLRGGEPT